MANNQAYVATQSYDAQLQIRDCSVSEPNTEYIGNINHPQRHLTDYVNFSLKSQRN
jgi:hypothetical protein